MQQNTIKLQASINSSVPMDELFPQMHAHYKADRHARRYSRYHVSTANVIHYFILKYTNRCKSINLSEWKYSRHLNIELL